MGTKLAASCSEIPNSSNLINRQDAIDIINADKVSKSIPFITLTAERDFKILNATCDRHIKMIEDLPSAQPEIIRCKDCRHYPSEHADCPMIGWARNENDFCSKAERKDHG